jgi:hypothetical protein
MVILYDMDVTPEGVADVTPEADGGVTPPPDICVTPNRNVHRISPQVKVRGLSIVIES